MKFSLRFCWLLTVFFLLSGVPVSFADESRQATINLTDGSQLAAEILSYHHGTYTVSVKSLGTLEIDEAKIRSISMEGDGKVPPVLDKEGRKNTTQGEGLNVTPEMVESTKNKVLSDPEAMEKVKSILGDPDVQAVLNDPEIIKLIQNQDYDALAKNPKIQNLTDKEAVQDLSKKAR